MEHHVRPFVLRTLLVSNYLNIIGFSLFGPLLGIYILKLGLTPLQISTALAVYSTSLGLCILGFGRWATGHSRVTRAIIAGYFLMVVGGLGYLWMQSVMQVYIVQIINAVAVALTTPSWKALYARTHHEGKESQSWSYFDGGNQLLAAGAMILGGVLLTVYGFRFLILALIVFETIGAILSLRLLKVVSRE